MLPILKSWIKERKGKSERRRENQGFPCRLLVDGSGREWVGWLCPSGVLVGCAGVAGHQSDEQNSSVEGNIAAEWRFYSRRITHPTCRVCAGLRCTSCTAPVTHLPPNTGI